MDFGHTIDYEIHIQASHNRGFIVEVGCARFIYQSKDSLVNDLEEYLNNPEEMKNRYATAFGVNPVPEEANLRTR